MQNMHGNIPYMFDCWADPVAHRFPLKSSMLTLNTLEENERERERERHTHSERRKRKRNVEVPLKSFRNFGDNKLSLMTKRQQQQHQRRRLLC